MKFYKIIAVCVISLSLFGFPTKGETESLEIVKPELTKAEIVSLIDVTADIHNVSAIVMHKVVQCESEYDPNNHYKTSREDSYGLVQINLMAHPEITKEQALDPKFALEFLASNLKKGKGSMWTCYMKYYG